MLNKTIIFLIIFLIPVLIYSQCCSAGSPTGINNYLTTINKKSLFVSYSHRFSINKDYYKGDVLLSDYGLLKNSFFNYSNLFLMYGLNKNTTIEFDIGYFINKTQTYDLNPPLILKGFGFSATSFSIKRSFLNNSENTRILMGSGFKVPLRTSPQFYNYVLLPPEIQPSTGAFAIMGIFLFSQSTNDNKNNFVLFNRLEYNFLNKNKYQYGLINISSLNYNRKFHKNFEGMLEIRNEFRLEDKRDGFAVINTGGNVCIASFRINFLTQKSLNLSVIYDYPIYRYYKGRQLGLSNSFVINISYLLN